MREAILKAADHIERTSGSLDWWNGTGPTLWNRGITCHACCPLAWIAHFNNMDGVFGHRRAAHALGVAALSFYEEMNALSGINHHFYGPSTSPWATDRTICANTLRKYADKHFPVKHEGIPDSVKEIFNVRLGIVSEVAA
jgi:hypothetical protein